jgi:hypothetical protein
MQFFVVPRFGVFACILGHAFSTIVCQRVVQYHDEIGRKFEQQSNDKIREENLQKNESSKMEGFEDDNVDSRSSLDVSQSTSPPPCELYKASFIRPHRPECAPLHVRSSVRYAYVAGCVVIPVFVLMGCILPLYYYRIDGFLSTILDMMSVDGDNKNVFSLMSNLIDTARGVGEARTYFGVIVLIIMMVVSLLIIPIALSMILLVRWILPLQDSTHLRLRYIHKILEAWMFTDALFFSIIVCAINGNQLTNVIASTFCGTISSVVRTLIYWGILEETASQCIIIHSKADISIYFFLILTLLLKLLKGFVDSAYDQRQNQDAPRRIIKKEDLVNFDTEVLTAKSKQLDAPRPIFTDIFRWTLESDSTAT